ncbi:MAG TPA: NlpC/P60 family protein, partial [Acidimicrobiia bacterium]
SRKAAALRELIVAWCDEVAEPREGDLVLLRWAGQPAHIGVMVNETDFIHSLQGIGAHIESVTSSRWRNRVDGYWRVRD